MRKLKPQEYNKSSFKKVSRSHHKKR